MLTCIYSISRSLQQKRFYYVRLQSANKNSTDTQTYRLLYHRTFAEAAIFSACSCVNMFLARLTI